jgi:hypothetical protein
MSSNPTGPFKTTRVIMPDGRPLFNLQEVYVVQGAQIMPGHVAFIDISGKEAGDAPTIRATVHDAVSHTLDTDVAIVPTKKQVGPGLRHISDSKSRGIRFCRMYQYDDNGNRSIAQEEIDFLFAWHAQHGLTGGTGDSSISVDPGTIPWEAWKPGAGKPGGTGGTAGEPVDVPTPTGDKPTGGEVTGAPDDRTEFHPADVNRDGLISREEKKAWNKKNPNDPVETGKS